MFCKYDSVFGLTYNSQLSIGKDSPVLVLCHALVHANVGQIQAADRQNSIIYLNSVLLETETHSTCMHLHQMTRDRPNNDKQV